MAKHSKEVKKSTKAATTVKKATKKNAPKKKAAPKKAVAKKTTVKKKAANSRKSVQPTAKKTASQKNSVNKQAKATQNVQEPIPIETNLPSIEEKNPEVIPVTTSTAPGMDIKSIQKEAVRHYDNHHIRLSNKKGGLKPAGKKPLW